MRLCRPSCHSLRELFFVVLLVAMLSVLATYHLSKHLPPRRQASELDIRFHGEMDVYENAERRPALIGAENKHLESLVRDSHRGLEGIDMEDWEKRTREKRNRKYDISKHKLRPELLHKLKQFDDELLPPSSVQKIAVIADANSVLSKQREWFEETLHKAGYRVIVLSTNKGNNTNQPRPGTGNDDGSYHGYSRQVWDTGWTIGICLYTLNPEDVHTGAKSTSAPFYECQSRSVNNLQPFQKFSIIPALNSMFIDKQQFCRTMSAMRYIPALLGNPLSPLCYLLPAQYEDFLTQADVRGAGSYWVLKPLEQHYIPVQLVEPTNERDYLKIKRLSESLTLVQEYLPSPLPLFGLPFSVTVCVLVTSWLPLRVHIHSQGIVHFRHDYQNNFRKVPGKTWTLEQWLHHVAETHTQSAADIAQKNMQIVIVQTLLATEVVAYHDKQINILLQKKLNRCASCFQLLSFELLFNSTFYPSIINIESNPDISDFIQLIDGPDGHLVHDIVTMVTSTTPVVADVALALEELNLETEVNFNRTCTTTSTHRTCLLPGDIQYWLLLRRETLQKGGFRLLYPSVDADKYNNYISNLMKYTEYHQRRHGTTIADDTLSVHRTASLHKLTISFMRHLQNIDRIEEQYDDLNVPWFSDIQPQSEDVNMNLLQNVYIKHTNNGDKHTKRSCVDDANELPYLEGIYTEPALDMSPVFNKSITDYYATVPYDVYLVKVWALTISCFSEARLEDKYGLSRPSNFTLGLGNNKISIVVVDVRHTEPWAINVYTVSIYRQQVGEGLLSADQGHPHTVCSLIQDCGLHYIPAEPCGLQQSVYYSWQQYLKHASVLPACNRGDEPGEWLVPCRSCNQSDSCSWSLAVWQPKHCLHKVLHRDSLKQCLAKKQILFIGDSTNRGIMHYLMEQVNDTLTEWDKTHNIRIYTNINRDQTTVSFAYYPQFWLPVSQRPVFDKALLDLMQQSGPLENNKNTVLVVGGVHWLASHHLKVITQTLHQQGLDKIHVIVKGLGAGFHQPVDGLHCLTLAEQRKLVIHNSGLIEFGRSHGFDVVDTFNMTMARYKDFLQGKCACHFHRVREVLPSFTQYMRSTGQSGSNKLTDMPILYHVEGDINAAYSEILMNRICEQS